MLIFSGPARFVARHWGKPLPYIEASKAGRGSTPPLQSGWPARSAPLSIRNEHDGVLGIMTKLVIDRKAFSNWHYKNDLTHVCFFSHFTFEWLTQKYDAQLEIIDADVILLTKTQEHS